MLGAIGHPDVKPGILEKGILLRLRFELDLYINLRPVKLYEGVECPLKDKGPEHIDFVVVRENTEGLYAGAGGFLKKGTLDEIAVQESINTRKGVERCIRFAFDYCQKRNKDNKLTLCELIDYFVSEVVNISAAVAVFRERTVYVKQSIVSSKY
ncbi:3-isopropylmalate dehydrogenase [Candidatus Magnetoovum chiemensis]|nr:3-isopropylmalate dehydrogenase [Candidatus Magnetoovum chiemensis]